MGTGWLTDFLSWQKNVVLTCPHVLSSVYNLNLCSVIKASQNWGWGGVWLYACQCKLHLLYPFVCWRTLSLLPCLAIVKWCCYRHWSICIFKLLLLFFSNIYPGVALLSHMVVLFLVFWELSILFSTVATPIYIPTNSVGGFPFLCIIANNFYLCFFGW